MLFALSSEHSVAQGIALSIRLLLQLGYDLSLSRNSSKALVLAAALCMNIIFIYYSADLTAQMTSQPKLEPTLGLRSFQDLEDQGYKVVSSGPGTLAHTNLKNAPVGSAMQRLYGSDRQGFWFVAEQEYLMRGEIDLH